MTVKFEPIAGTKNRIVVQPLPVEEKTAGGIIIPDTAKEKPQKGTVISTSKLDVDGKPPVLNSGDVILYGKYAGTEITHNGEEYLIMYETDVYLKLNQ